MSFYPANRGNGGKQLLIFTGGINLDSRVYDGKMPTDTDINMLYVWASNGQSAFPWIGDGSHYVHVRIYLMSDRAKKFKRIRMRAFHNGQFLGGMDKYKIAGKNCTVTNVSKEESGFDEVFDVTKMTGEYFEVGITNSSTNYVTGFEIVEAE